MPPTLVEAATAGNGETTSAASTVTTTPASKQQQQPEQPDSDAIKMFVGQVPRSMDEAELRLMFEDFGAVYQINVLRDKITGQSRGRGKKRKSL